MARFLHHHSFGLFRRNYDLLLAFFWITGLVSGLMLSPGSDPVSVSLMRMSAAASVSIIGLIASLLLPFLFSAFAVYLGLPQILFVICFCKAFVFTFVSWAVAAAFGSAGWLVRQLLMFSDCCCCVLLYWYCQRHISGQRHFSPGVTGLFLMAICFVAGFDYCFVAPLLRGVLSS